MAAALTSVSMIPAHIQDLFVAGTDNSRIYAVKLFIRGKPWTVTVDNVIPIYIKNNRIVPYYLDIFRYHMWSPILYKAMAKVYGSYSNFSAQDDTVNALKMLTGAPVFNLNLK